MVLAGCGRGGGMSGQSGSGGAGENPAPSNTPFWAQWGANPQHTGMVSNADRGARVCVLLDCGRVPRRVSMRLKPFCPGPMRLRHVCVIVSVRACADISAGRSLGAEPTG